MIELAKLEMEIYLISGGLKGLRTGDGVEVRWVLLILRGMMKTEGIVKLILLMGRFSRETTVATVINKKPFLKKKLGLLKYSDALIIH
jgi:hypothetical protein